MNISPQPTISLSLSTTKLIPLPAGIWLFMLREMAAARANSGTMEETGTALPNVLCRNVMPSKLDVVTSSVSVADVCHACIHVGGGG
ncbi:hypothetical protein ABVT39_005687 [Epinephelus coioides]